MKSVLFTLVCLSFFHNEVYAQKENNHWVAGLYVKVDFNSPVPTATNGQYMLEGSCAVSDRHTGALMFSSNGLNVWDKNGVIMPNGTGLIAGGSNGVNTTFQATVAVPFPDDTTRFYLFHLQGQDSQGDNAGALHYSVVDMTLNGGLGDVVAAQKNIFVHDSLSEGMVAVKGDGCSVWVVTHTRVNNIYKAFEVTSLGVNTTPVVSSLPNDIYYPQAGTWASAPYNFTELKCSPDARFLSLTSQGYAILNDFDKLTGVVSNPLTLDSVVNSPYTFAVFSCFSPGGDFLYVSQDGWNFSEQLYQYNVSAGSPAAIMASKTVVDTGAWWDMQIVEDKVYVIRVEQGNNGCGVINDPDVAGAGCNFDPTSFNFAGNGLILGTTQNLVVYPNPGTQYNSKDTAGCSTNMLLSGRDNALGYQWDDGTITQSITATAVGTYWVASQFPCNLIVDTFHVTHQLDTITTASDTNICDGATVTLSGVNGATSYLWNNGSTAQNQTTGTPGQYWVRSVFECELFVDTFYVTNELDTVTSATDSVLCNGATATFSGRAGANSYLWNNASTLQPQTTSATGQYWVRSVFDCDVYIDTFNVNAVSVAIDLGADAVLCNGESITLSANASGGTYQWQDGSTVQTFTTDAAGTYYVTVSNQGCTAADTISIEVQSVSVVLEDRMICAGDSLVMDITQPGATYLWQDGSTSGVYVATAPGNYQATVTINGCSGTDNFYLEHYVFPKVGIITGQLSYCLNEQVALRAQEIPNYTYLWQDGTTGPVLIVNKEGKYVVTISNSCETYNDSIDIVYKQCDCTDYMPNTFTPNNDGKNDKIGVGIDCAATEFEFAIYNRWGNMVFHTNDPMQKWDGIYKGEPCDIGTYGYYYQFVSPRGDEIQKKGMIHLLR